MKFSSPISLVILLSTFSSQFSFAVGFEGLPDDVLLNVFQKLQNSGTSLRAATCVNRQLHRVVTNNFSLEFNWAAETFAREISDKVQNPSDLDNAINSILQAYQSQNEILEAKNPGILKNISSIYNADYGRYATLREFLEKAILKGIASAKTEADPKKKIGWINVLLKAPLIILHNSRINDEILALIQSTNNPIGLLKKFARSITFTPPYDLAAQSERFLKESISPKHHLSLNLLSRLLSYVIPQEEVEFNKNILNAVASSENVSSISNGFIKKIETLPTKKDRFQIYQTYLFFNNRMKAQVIDTMLSELEKSPQPEQIQLLEHVLMHAHSFSVTQQKRLVKLLTELNPDTWEYVPTGQSWLGESEAQDRDRFKWQQWRKITDMWKLLAGHASLDSATVQAIHFFKDSNDQLEKYEKRDILISLGYHATLKDLKLLIAEGQKDINTNFLCLTSIMRNQNFAHLTDDEQRLFLDLMISSKSHLFVRIFESGGLDHVHSPVKEEFMEKVKNQLKENKLAPGSEMGKAGLLDSQGELNLYTKGALTEAIKSVPRNQLVLKSLVQKAIEHINTLQIHEHQLATLSENPHLQKEDQEIFADWAIHRISTKPTFESTVVLRHLYANPSLDGEVKQKILKFIKTHPNKALGLWIIS